MKTLKEITLDKSKALILRPDGNHDTIDAQELRDRMDKPEGFRALQDIVGGSFEFVYLDNWILAVNENGLNRNLEPNQEACDYSGRYLVGDCLLIHRSYIR
jgi:hypothetical protein